MLAGGANPCHSMVPPMCDVGRWADLAAVAPCWWTRAMVELTLGRQSISPSASAWAFSAVRALS